MKTFARKVHRALGAIAVGGALAAAPSALHAQGAYAGISFLTSYPQGEFKDHVDHAGFGGELHGAYHFGTLPVMLGAELGIMSYGSSSREEPFSTTIPDVTVRVETSHNIGHGNLFLRLQPDEGVVRPYAEGVLGTHYFFTETTIRDKGHWDSEQNAEVASSTNQDDWAIMYGAGAGMLIRVYEGDQNSTTTYDALESSSGIQSGFITLGLRYLKGGQAEYLTTGSVHRTNGTVTYDVTTSRTDLLVGQIGFEMRF